MKWQIKDTIYDNVQDVISEITCSHCFEDEFHFYVNNKCTVDLLGHVLSGAYVLKQLIPDDYEIMFTSWQQNNEEELLTELITWMPGETEKNVYGTLVKVIHDEH